MLIPAKSAADKTTELDNSDRHPPSSPLMTKLPRYPTRIPPTMKHSFSEMSKPRTLEGAVSAMYIGAACIANPMPRPYTNRPATNASRDGAPP